jgi:hypothetical protein
MQLGYFHVMAEPVSTVQALVRVHREADEATKALLKAEAIDQHGALILVQQTDEAVKAAIVAGVERLNAEAEAAPEGKTKSLTGSQQGDAKVNPKTGKAKATRNAVEALRDAAKGKDVQSGGKDATRAVAAPKAPATAETVGAVRARADAMMARAMAQSGLTDADRTYLCGVRDALEALFDAQWIVGTSHPHQTAANAVLARRKA